MITPFGVILPMPSLPASVNQRLPSEPAAIPYGNALAVGTVYSVIALIGAEVPAVGAGVEVATVDAGVEPPPLQAAKPNVATEAAARTAIRRTCMRQERARPCRLTNAMLRTSSLKRQTLD